MRPVAQRPENKHATWNTCVLGMLFVTLNCSDTFTIQMDQQK